LGKIELYLFNPIKHGYIRELKDYKWGSYRFRLKREFDYLDEIRKKYPWDKVNVKDDF